jgi:hypothetical protein
MASMTAEVVSEKFAPRGVLTSLVRFLAVFLLFAAATAIFFCEWMPYLRSALIGVPEDNMQDFWNAWYTAFAYHDGRFLFTNLIRFPEGTPLIYHSFAYPQVFAVALISKALHLGPSSLILQQNLSLLISFPLAGTGAFYLVRHFADHAGAALLGGFVFAFNPSHIEHVMHHMGISQIEFIPFFVLAYLVTIESKSVLALMSAIVFFALSALSCWYYLFYVAYFVVFHTMYVAIRDRSLPSSWQLMTPIACVAGVGAILSPLLVPMVNAAMVSNAVYHASYKAGTDTYVADLFAYAAFPPFHLLGRATKGIYSRFSGNEWEATVYLGLVNVAVLAWLWKVGRQKERELLTYVVSGMLLFSIVATGDSLHVLGHRIMPMPGVVLSHLALVKNVQTPSRAIIFVYLFLAIGVGCAAALAWRSSPRHFGRWGVGAVATLIVLDFFPAHRLPMTPPACSPGLALIRDDPDTGFGVLDLPSGYTAGNVYMFQQTCHGRPIAQGNTSRDVITSLRDRLETRDLQAQRRQLIGAKIKYIVINRRPMGIPLPWQTKDGALDDYSSVYPVVYAGQDLTVLGVY